MEKNIYNLFAPGNFVANWKIVREIGGGMLGKVFMVIADSVDQPHSVHCAVAKIIPSTSTLPPRWEKFLKQEYKIWLRIGGQSIVRLVPQPDTKFVAGEQSAYYLIMEYCPGGNLEQFIAQYPQHKMPEAHVFLCLEQIIAALNTAHEHKLVHGSITPENIVLGNQKNFQLTDFVLSSWTMDQAKMLYQAPEVLQNHQISFASDIWSLGVLGYRMLTGQYPFLAHDPQELCVKIEQQLDWPLDLARAKPESITGILTYFIRQMLAPMPKKRPQIKDLSSALERCQHFISLEERRQFIEMLHKEILDMDLRPKTQFLQYFTKDDEPSSAPKPKPKITSIHTKNSYKKWVFLSCLLCLGILAGIWYMDWIPTITQLRSWMIQPIHTLEIKPEFPDFRWRIRLVVDPQSPISPEIITQALVHLQHIQGDNIQIESTWENLIQGNFVWEVPLDMPDGELQIWAAIQSGEKIILQSQPQQLIIQSSFVERQMFKQAEIIARELEQKGEEYEKIGNVYRQYLDQYPEGYFKEKAQSEYQLYQDKAMSFEYHKILSLARKEPPNIEEILAATQVFLQKYNEQPASQKILEIQDYFTFWTIRRPYQITLTRGAIMNRLLKADCYVKVFVNNSLLWTSHPVINQNRPVWNSTFTISWQTGDIITVELWDRNISLVQDRRYFAKQDPSIFAIQMLNGRVGNPEAWVEFTCSSLPNKTW